MDDSFVMFLFYSRILSTATKPHKDKQQCLAYFSQEQCHGEEQNNSLGLEKASFKVQSRALGDT